MILALSKKCRVTRDAADRWEYPARQKLVWCPVGDLCREDEDHEVAVADLVDYEGLENSFSAPESLTWYDARYGLGYR
jgi:hypothetical protein